MPTVWGHVEVEDTGSRIPRHIQVRTTAQLGIIMQLRAIVRAQTLITRGVEWIDLSDLRNGEFVELTYVNKSGRLEAETIYVQPDPVTKQSPSLKDGLVTRQSGK